MNEERFDEGTRLISQAKALVSAGDYQAAEEILARAVVWDEPAVPPIAAVELAMVFEATARDDGTVDLYRAAVDSGCVLAGVMAAGNLGDLHMRYGREGEARSAWTKSVELAGSEHGPIADDSRKKLEALDGP